MNAYEVISMKIIKASQLPKKMIQDFLKSAHQIKVENILQSGYMLEVGDKITGCFVLEKITDQIYELKKFYLVSTEAIKIPTLFEAILSIAQENGAEQVVVNSQKLMTDIILQSLNFYPQTNTAHLEKEGKKGGKWWSYTISD